VVRNWIDLALDWHQWRDLVNTVMNLLKKNSAQRKSVNSNDVLKKYLCFYLEKRRENFLISWAAAFPALCATMANGWKD
jgi:hypothetical protein